MDPDPPAPLPVLEYHSPQTSSPLYGLAVISRNLAWLSILMLPVSLVTVVGLEAAWPAWGVVGICVALGVAAIALARHCLRWTEHSLHKLRALAIWAQNLAILSLIMGAMLCGLLLLLSTRHRSDPGFDLCASNLRRIGEGVLFYASEHKGTLPAQLGDLLLGSYLESRVFCCRLSTDTPAQGNTPAERAADLAKGGHLSYVYVGQGLTTKQLSPNTVLAFEPPGRHGQGKKAVRVFFADGHLEFMDVPTAQKLLSNLPPPATQASQSLIPPLTTGY